MANGWDKYHLSGFVVVYMPIFTGDESEEPSAFEPVELSLVSMQSHWDLNGIPSCDLRVAVGRDGYNLEPAAIHELLKDMQLLIAVEVYLQVELTGSDFTYTPDPWPLEPFVAFDGYVVGVTEATSFGSMSIGLSCTHWLSDMAFSSAVSRSSSPRNPAEFSFGASFRGLVGGAANAFYSTGHPGAFFTSAAITQDFWGQAIAKWFDHLCSHDRFQVPLVSTRLADKNNEALDALRRFEGVAGGRFPDYRFASPLVLDIHNLGVGLLAASISKAINTTPPESVAVTTLWDKLAGDLAAQYLFAVVPMIDRALVVPFTPGLRSTWTTIAASEYDAVESVFDLPRPVRGVGLVGQTNGVAGAVSAFNQAPGVVAGVSPLVGLGGYFENLEQTYRRGTTLIKFAPPWLQNVTTTFFNARVAADPGKPRAAAASPDAAAPAATTLHPLARFGQAKTMWNDFARMLYLLERLKGRRMTLRGRLRFDIAPGSTVKVIVVQEKFLREQLGDVEEVYAHVNRVSISVDCEAQKAYTMLNLSHVRSPEENTLDAYSTDRHFLYEPVFRGAPLLKDLVPLT